MIGRTKEVAPLAGSVDRNYVCREWLQVSQQSLPSRGAWIEMCDRRERQTRQLVAPLAGSVDRNAMSQR